MSSPPSRRAFVGLGSNVAPAANLRRALDELSGQFGAVARSPVCVSGAAGYDGPDYWNLCVGFDTSLSAAALVAWLKGMERRLGRAAGEPRLAPKTIDADLLLLGDTQSASPPLPHPEVFTRAYVLGPLAMLAPERILPGHDTTVGELWKDFPGADALTVLPPDPL
ncbi:2-amino-4-hydroxy-6- hydroxymethyldihydropteridine pyrophosphokinase [Thioalkalivibrio nitratireducens DSM 14787]|uniref:2-amino-4-hydroxy-6-hydroxymethyldihydropteridine pyrophosphokinase n=1 Tax=Thioalkalivibrio nitratireducens (strain DSM 14787 / UNIQEM 213 / ALEN2) TaxID=1255043 RepID=L0DT15_THIND|nr:2-amino-4-hydroxy-6-hydroxymethyldihydropteridine diphosphokinase [Thioalkalivibrio nitratireducens]AGA32137.1 2-amino-4-hydroxy-6- hydroxymethyldihydropteridine pyrophosphokinase [Thioalkalivibrio nitratireducens DSM 14787]